MQTYNANLQTNKASKEVIPTASQHFVHSMKWKKKKGFQSENLKEVSSVQLLRLFATP